MSESILMSVEALAALVSDGAQIAVSQDAVGVSMAITRELVRNRVRDLRLVCVPISGLQADVLIGAGCVSEIETSAVTLGEFGTGPRFAAAIKAGRLKVRDATCPAIHAALQAGQKGLPFMPLRGLLGTDVLKQREDWRVIDNPFQAGDAIVALPAIRPDFAVFHAPLADRFGNVFIGRQRDLLTMAQAAQKTLVTVEAITEHDLMQDPNRSPGVIPGIYVTQIAHAPKGAWPLRFLDQYALDEVYMRDYVRQAQSDTGFSKWLAQWLHTPQAVAVA